MASLSVELDPETARLTINIDSDIARGDAEIFENPISEVNERFQVPEQRNGCAAVTAFRLSSIGARLGAF